MPILASGRIEKLKSTLQQPVAYALPIGDARIDLNPLLGKTVQLKFEGVINCINCNRKTSKSFSQGYCYPCFQKLAACDSCIVSPEKCHFAQGTCREPEWAQSHCMVEHIVYLANSSDLKVGITRASQIPTRWIDQGAIQALPILRVQTRQQSGLVEDAIRKHVADKTAWQKMLKGIGGEIDLQAEKARLLPLVSEALSALQGQFGLQAIQVIDDAQVTSISYPVLEYPTKVVAFNFDKDPLVEGTLLGIKGQYLMFDTGVINVRKFTAYNLSVSA